MTVLAFILFLVSVTFLILGLIKPKWAWSKSRMRVMQIFASLSVIMFLCVGYFASADQKKDETALVEHEAVAPDASENASPHTGLGVKRSDITDLLEPVGFKFEQSPSNNGRENFIAEYGVTIVQLFGPQAELDEIQFLIADAKGEAATKHQAATIMAVLNTVFPDWAFSDIGTWIAQSAQSKTGQYTQSGKRITFSIHDGLGLASIVIKPVTEGQ
ncbi:MAG: hypothetical protein GYB52_06835 [Rhodospirillales bacterium]|nr:hypothetical protein [Rhodospirillales bacterium]MBR9816329.1 hypothetical protein [Rhodospirillales bacterium]